MIEKICERLRVLILNDHQRISPRVKNEIDVLSKEYDVHVLNWNRERTQDVPCKDEKLDWINLEAPKGSVKLALYLPILYWKIMRKLHNKKNRHPPLYTLVFAAYRRLYRKSEKHKSSL